MPDGAAPVAPAPAAAPTSGCPIDHDFDPLAPAYLADPYAVADRVREATPVFYAPSLDMWVVSRMEDVEAVFSDHETFSGRIVQDPVFPVCDAARACAVRGVPPAARDVQQRAPGPRAHPGPHDQGVLQPAHGDAGAVHPCQRRAPGRRDAGRRAAGRVRPRSGLPAARLHRVPPHRLPRRGRRATQALVRQPQAVPVGPGHRGRAGGHRREHGRLLALLPGVHRRQAARPRATTSPATCSAPTSTIRTSSRWTR